MIPVIGFAPDIDQATPGAIMACDNVIPTIKGMAGAPTALDAGLPALAAACRGAAVLKKLDGTKRVLAGTQSGLYELSGSAWIDVAQAGGYAGGVDSVWRFAQMGNVTVATNGADPLQSSSSSAFADIADAPKAAIVETASKFILAFNYTHTSGTRTDGWWCSDLANYATWTPADDNEAANGFLATTPGDITAGKRLGYGVVAYKQDSMYLGQYVGKPKVWDFTLVSSTIGAVSQEAVIDTGTEHVFMGKSDFYRFDGSSPRPLGNRPEGSPVREWFFRQMADPHKVKSHFDPDRKLCWWFYADKNGISRAIIYHLPTDKWGLCTVTAQAALTFSSPDVTFDEWPEEDVTFDAMADEPYDSPSFETSQMALFGADNKIKTMTGPCVNSSLVTGEIGQDDFYTTLTSVIPRFVDRPESATMSHYTKRFDGDGVTIRGSAPMNGHKFDALASGRYHVLRWDFIGDWEMVGYNPKLVQDGEL